MSRPIIEVENVSKRYKLGQFNARTLRDEVEQFFRRLRRKNKAVGVPHVLAESSEFWALKDVSFSVQRGEVVGIIGRNGAGKSTLLKILSRVTEPTSGEIRIRGRVASLLEVGTGFHPELTGRENIYLNGTILGMTKAEVRAKFDEIVAFAETEKFLDTPVKRYSSGMHVRLAFAIAAHLEPEILIVDEVLAVGDAEFQRKCLGKMQDVGRGGRTVLLVSHNIGAIEMLCKRTILLEGGFLAYEGFTREAVAKYFSTHALRNVAVFESHALIPSITKTLVHDKELLHGNLVIDIDFKSPYILAPAIPGVCLYTDQGMPVFASNPRIHSDGFEAKNLTEGRLRFAAYDLPLVEGTYFLSFWLGDWHKDYDYKRHVLAVDFRPRNPPLRPLQSSEDGPLNWPAHWKSAFTSYEP